MSDTQITMKFELLPNELLIQCFEYLNAPHIFHSFDQLNDRFNHLIRHISLYMNLEEDVNKSIFDKFCVKILLNPQIKDQIYSLNLPSSEDNNPAGLRSKTFLSSFSLEDFLNLRKFKTNADVKFIPIGTISSNFKWKNTLELPIKSFPKLRALSIPKLDANCATLDNTHLSVTKLTLDSCDLNTLLYLSKHAPMLKYLHVNEFDCSEDLFDNNTKECCFNLQQLIIDGPLDSFDELETFVKLTPNLTSLTISDGTDDMNDAVRWERLISSSLTHLKVIRFIFNCSYSEDEHDIIINKFQQFQTHFWQEKYHAFIEYAISDDSALIYTTPYVSNMYELEENYKRYSNNLKNNVNTFVNVTKLTLDLEILTETCEDYFPNVTSLVLEEDFKCLTVKQIEYLEKIVNLFHLKHLDISDINLMKNSLLLKLLDQMPHLFILSVSSDQLIEIFKDNQLCKYLNKMIKKLHLTGNYDNHFDDDLFKRNQFYEVFSNIEHLEFEYSQGDALLFSLNRLPKLSTLKATWNTKNDFSSIPNNVEKLNLIYDIDIQRNYDTDYDSSSYSNYDSSWDSDPSWDSDSSWDSYRKSKRRRYDIEIRMWFGNNMF